MTTETKILALAELKGRRQVPAFEVEQGRDGAVQELELEQQVGALNQQERQALAEKEPTPEQRRQQLGAAAAGLGRRPNSVWSTGGRYRASRGASVSGTTQTMANAPMRPLPVRSRGTAPSV